MANLTKLAAILIAISAVLHLIAPIVSDFSAESLALLLFMLIYGFLSWQVWNNKRWAMWISFFFMLFGGIAGLAGFLAPQTIPAWVSLGIWIADWAAAVMLLLVLWRDRQV